MTDNNFGDEVLVAFADGELDGSLRNKVVRAMETDPDVAARVAMFLQSRSTAKEALSPLLDEPVPASLVESVRASVDAAEATGSDARAPADNVIPLAGRPKATKTHVPVSRWAVPMAASVALVAGGLAGFLLAGSDHRQRLAGIELADLNADDLLDALTMVASGEERQLRDGGDRFRAIATYRDDNDAVCREFEVDKVDLTTVVAVACKPNESWMVRFAVVANQNESGYAPASSLEALEAYLNASGAGAPLAKGEELEALSTLQN